MANHYYGALMVPEEFKERLPLEGALGDENGNQVRVGNFSGVNVAYVITSSRRAPYSEFLGNKEFKVAETPFFMAQFDEGAPDCIFVESTDDFENESYREFRLDPEKINSFGFSKDAFEAIFELFEGHDNARCFLELTHKAIAKMGERAICKSYVEQ